MNVINLSDAFGQIPEPWRPRIAGALNDSYVKLAKLQGEFVWHQHEQEDELFLVIAGQLTIKTRAGDLHIGPGEFVIIPRGMEHCPLAEEEVQVLLLEPKSTQNTGDAQGARAEQLQADAEWLPGLRPGGAEQG